MDKETTTEEETNDNNEMLFVVHCTHTPENSPVRSKEGAQVLVDFWAKRNKAEGKGIKILNAYVAATEHTYYIIMQAQNYQSIMRFFAPLISTQQIAVHPVTTMDAWTNFIEPQ